MTCKSRIVVLIALSICVLTNSQVSSQEAQGACHVVELESGLRIVGTVNKTSEAEKPFHAYRGIPFAEPPLGDLRFRPPVPLPQNLSGRIVDASNDKSQCVQFGVPVKGSEDCLYINVYSPIVNNSSELLPVMVWIHGGGFIIGNSSYSLYGPDYLLNEDVVVVTFNYRLGVFGFLSTADEASPGNYGLRDQILALRWVQDNIDRFRGNKSRVTVFGESAGAASASYLSQTPWTNGLFQSMILESGNSLTPWALTRNPKAVAKAIALFLNANSTMSSYVDFFRKVDYEMLGLAQVAVAMQVGLAGNLLSGLPFGPTIEPYYRPDTIVTNYTFERLNKGLFHRVPYLMGLNSQEGIPFQKELTTDRSYLLKYDLDGMSLVPSSLNITNSSVKLLVNSIIKAHYFGHTPITTSRRELLNFLSDDQFNRPITEAGLLYSKFAPVYFYEFSYKGPLGSGYSKIPGVGHADELYYLFKSQHYPGNPVSSDILTRQRLVKLWTNFAKTGNPTPIRDPLLQNINWPSTDVNDSNLSYLNINETLTNMYNPKWSAFLFWTDLFNRFGNPPYDTF